MTARRVARQWLHIAIYMKISVCARIVFYDGTAIPIADNRSIIDEDMSAGYHATPILGTSDQSTRVLDEEASTMQNLSHDMSVLSANSSIEPHDQDPALLS